MNSPQVEVDHKTVSINTKTAKADLVTFLTANGILVEGDEKKDELLEAALNLIAFMDNL